MKFIKRFILLLIMIFIYIFVFSLSYTSYEVQNISNNILRLHIIANSNSEHDQKIKLIVRDRILDYSSSIIPPHCSKFETIDILEKNIPIINSIITNTFTEYNYYESFNVSIKKCNFPTKTYGNISLPTGSYDSLQIEIGDAIGKNWWCVMFPPLCIIDTTTFSFTSDSDEYLYHSLNTEEYNLITQNSSDYKIKFKIVEILNNLKIDLNI